MRGCIPNDYTHMTSLGTPLGCSRSVPTLILALNCVIISIVDITVYSYLILCHLPYITYNMIEIYIICHYLFSKTIIHYNMLYIIDLNIHKTNKYGWKSHGGS